MTAVGNAQSWARVGKRYTICTTHLSNLPIEVNAQFVKTSLPLCIGVNGQPCKPNEQRASCAQRKNTGTGKKELCDACYGKLDASAKTTYDARQKYAQCVVCKTRRAIARLPTSKKLTHCRKCKTDDMIANETCQSFGNKICNKTATYVHVDTYDAFLSARKNGRPEGRAKQPSSNTLQNLHY